MFESFERRGQKTWPVRRILVSVAVIVAVYGMIRWSRAKEERALRELNPEMDRHVAADDRQALDDALSKIPRAGGPPTRRIDLPGMSLEMPGSPEVQGDYQRGSASLTPIARVAWGAGTLASEADYRKQLEPVARLMADNGLTSDVEGPRGVLLDGEPARWFSLGQSPNKIMMVIGTCGGRIVRQVSYREDVSEQLRRTFRCTPDPEHAKPGHAKAAEITRAPEPPVAALPPITSDVEYLARGQRMAQHQVDILNRTTCDKLAADLEMLLNDPEFEAVSAYGYRNLSVADKLEAEIKDLVTSSRLVRVKRMGDCVHETRTLADMTRFEGGQATSVRWW